MLRFGPFRRKKIKFELSGITNTGVMAVSVYISFYSACSQITQITQLWVQNFVWGHWGAQKRTTNSKPELNFDFETVEKSHVPARTQCFIFYLIGGGDESG